MATLLHIDTAGEKAMVAISQNGVLKAIKENEVFQTHASFLQVAIQTLVAETAIPLNSIDAIAVTMGPGSYTGLRIGVSAAKGLCYALNISLIAVDTLQTLASQAGVTDGKIIPMLDARRMEVYSEIFNADLTIERGIKAEHGSGLSAPNHYIGPHEQQF